MARSVRVRSDARHAAILATLTALLLTIALTVTDEVRSAGPHPGVRSLELGCHSPARRLSVLMIGNSYTARNDLPATLATVLCRGGLATNVRVEQLAIGGGSLAGWAAAGAAAHFPGHDVVVLQDQSQLPSFGVDSSAYQGSLAAVADLGAAAAAAHARVVLFETWGHHDGDETNRELSPTYDVMQTRLSEGYAGYLAALRGAGAGDARIARVGDAWSSVHRRDPDVFDDLYAADGSHPSATGTYLAALVLARAITGRPLPARPWAPWALFFGLSTVQAAARNA